ncbi:TetR/AcrR family transcriptional regulator [Adlercreutzia sp. ZJ138]|uniref:TetR/AcrR family transcriptional regulator n=1 Tax=Adlercreutzia sp. ZJ138 TaxID=2709405 RepID=UPI0013EBD76F|nr:TetR/AcrR family transcriptional regulator [Adlercreutzia sp. ZJ138]
MTKHTPPEQMRAKLFDAFSGLMQKKTYESITTRAIAEEAGVSYSALYTYFGSKEDFLLAYCEASPFLKGDAFLDALKELPLEEAQGMTVGNLAAFITTVTLEAATGRAAMVADLNMAALAMRNENVRERYSEMLKVWLKSIEEAVVYCRIPTDSVAATAQLVESLAVGLGFNVAVFGESWDADALMKLLRNEKRHDGCDCGEL